MGVCHNNNSIVSVVINIVSMQHFVIVIRLCAESLTAIYDCIETVLSRYMLLEVKVCNTVIHSTTFPSCDIVVVCMFNPTPKTTIFIMNQAHFSISLILCFHACTSYTNKPLNTPSTIYPLISQVLYYNDDLPHSVG